MPHSLTAKKRVRQTEKRRLRNRSAIGTLRTEVKKFSAAIAAADAQKALQAMKVLEKHLDKLVTKGIIHGNQASRRKSRMAAHLKALKAGSPAEAGKPPSRPKS